MLQKRKDLLLYLLKFFGVFALLFYGTEAVIGFSAPGNHYNRFVADNLNFIQPFRHFLLLASKSLLSAWDFRAEIRSQFSIGLVGGRAVRIVYSCIGYGVLSFWIAFVMANRGCWRKKLSWAIGGALAICTLNIVRISLVLVAFSKGWAMPLGWDHHTWFNILSYLLIFAMIYAYDKKSKGGVKKTGKKIALVQKADQPVLARQNG